MLARGDSNQALVAWGEQVVPVGFDSERFTELAAGRFHSVGLKGDGTVTAWGRNNQGQCAVPAGLSNVVQVAAGGWHSVAVRADGSVAVWGTTNYGVAAVPGTASGVKSAVAGTFYTLALRTNGSVVAWGANEGGQTAVPAGLVEVIALAAGNRHALALKSDGTVVAWGTNTSGQINVPGSVNGVIGIAAGDSHSLALKADGTVSAWGDNSYGQCSVPSGLSGVVQIAAGAAGSAALRSDGTVVTWGDGSVGQTNAPPTPQNFIRLRSAGWHHLALRSDGTLGAWGWNGFGQSLSPEMVTGLVQVTAGEYHNAAVRDTGGLLAWGNTSRGQLTPLTPLSNLAEVAVGQWHTAARTASGSIAVFGAADDFQTNLPASAITAVSLAAGDAHTLVARADGTVVAWGRTNGGACDVPPGLSGVTQVAAGAAYSLALGGGTVTAWGEGSQGVTNVPTEASGATSVAAGRFHALALCSDGTVVAWGRTNEGQTTVPPGLTDVTHIAAGAFHSVALQSSGTVTAWGRSDLGQNVVPDALTNAVQVAAGRFHTLALHPATTRPVVPLALLVHPQSRVVAAGSASTFGVSVEGTGPFTFQWYRNGVALSGETNASLTLPFTLPQDSGALFAVEVTGPGGSILSQAGELQVIGVRPATISGQPVSQSVGIGSNATFTVTASSNGPLFYQWLQNGTNRPGATSSVLVLTNVGLAENGNQFQAIAYTAGGAATSTVAVLSVGLTVPQPISAIAISAGSVALTWPDATPHESAFEVSRRPVPGGPYVPVVTTPANRTVGLDSNAFIPGVTRRGYRVRALASNGVSSASSPETISVQQLPSAPGIVGTLVRGASRYSALTCDTNWAYFSTAPPAGAIWRIPRTGGVMNAVAVDLTNAVTALAAYENWVFWREGTGSVGHLRVTYATGTGPVVTLRSDTLLSAPAGVSSLAVHGYGVFWSEGGLSLPGGLTGRIRGLLTASVTNAANFAGAVPVTVADTVTPPSPILADSNHVYWCDRLTNGGPTAALYRADNNGSNAQQLAGFGAWLAGAAQNDSAVYLNIWGSGTYRVSKPGGTATLIRATNLPANALLAAGERFLYSYDGTLAGLVRTDLTGSNTTRLLVPPSAPAAILADSKGVIWTTNAPANVAAAVGYWQSLAPLTIASPLQTNLAAGTLLVSPVTTDPTATYIGATGLPEWLTFDPENSTLVGTPPAPGTNQVTLLASNYVDSTSAQLTIVATSSPPLVTVANEWAAYIGVPFSKTILTEPASATVTVTGLPTWASFDAESHVVSGTPDSEGTNLVTLEASTAYGTSNRTLTLFSYLAAPNDSFEYAADYPDGTPFLESSLTGTHRESGEPLHAGATNQGGSLWFTWTAPGDGRMSASTAGSSCRTLLALYSGDTLTNLTELTFSLDDQPDGSALLAAPVTSGTTYRIAVALAAAPAHPVHLAVTFHPAGNTGILSCVTVPAGLATFSTAPVPTLAGAHPAGTVVDITATPSAGHTITNVTTPEGVPVNPHRVLVDTNRTVVFHLDNGPVPDNDAFSAAVTVTGMVDVLISGTNYAATSEPGEPAGVGTLGRTLWWSWTAPGDGRVLLMSPATGATSVAAAYTGTNVEGLIAPATDRTILPEGTLAASFPVTSNTTYHIALDSAEAGFLRTYLNWYPAGTTAAVSLVRHPLAGGTILVNPAPGPGNTFPLGSAVHLVAVPADHYEMGSWSIGETTTNLGIIVTGPTTAEVTFVTGPVPSNDDWENAAVLVGTQAMDASYSRYAAAQPGEPEPFGETPSAPVWWVWTAPWSGPVRVSTLGSDFNTRLAVYSGTLPTNVVLLAANDDDGVELTSAAEFTAVGGASYYLVVDSADSSRGTVQLSLNLTPSPAIIDQWFSRYVPGAEDGSDDDRDGIPALVEFAFGTDPAAFDPLPVPYITHDEGVNADYLTFEYTVDLTHPGVTVSLEWTEDLITWSNATENFIILDDFTANNRRTRIVRDVIPAGSSPTRFVRLRANR